MNGTPESPRAGSPVPPAGSGLGCLNQKREGPICMFSKYIASLTGSTSRGKWPRAGVRVLAAFCRHHIFQKIVLPHYVILLRSLLSTHFTPYFHTHTPIMQERSQFITILQLDRYTLQHRMSFWVSKSTKLVRVSPCLSLRPLPPDLPAPLNHLQIRVGHI